MKEKYWLKGGIIFTIVMSIFATIAFYVKAIGVFTYVAPAAFVGFLSLGMRGTPAQTSEVIQTLVMALGITLISYFIVGMILGVIYKRIKGNKILTAVGFIIVAMALGSVVYLGTTPNYTSVSQCESSITRLRQGFREDMCYWQVARVKQDITICNSLPDNRGNFSKYGCYTTVASDTRNSSICEKIPSTDEFGYPSRHFEDCKFYSYR
jgi:hypothetical protein